MRLAWGEGLLSFKPEANLAGQIAKVEVYGWDPKKKEKIVGIARAGEESGSCNGKSAGEHLKAFVKRSRASSRRCACASRCSRRPRPTSAPRRR